jgi:DNA-binding response OmpR family regulator
MSERKTILIAEDDELNLEFFELMLSKLGFDVEKASDGKAALELLKRGRIDLVLANTILPEISGWEILKTVQGDSKLSSIPVILLSDIDNVKEKVESYEQGAEDYVTKPFNFSVLLSRIRAALRKRELLVQIKLREERLNLAGKTGREIKKYLASYSETVGRIGEQIVRLTDEPFDAKTAAAFLKKMRKQCFATQKEIKDMQAEIDGAFSESNVVKAKEIGLNQLEHPEKPVSKRG